MVLLEQHIQYSNVLLVWYDKIRYQKQTKKKKHYKLSLAVPLMILLNSVYTTS